CRARGLLRSTLFPYTTLFRSQGNGPLWLRGQRSGELGELMLAHTDAVDGYFSGFQPVRAEMVVVPLAIAIAVASVNWVVALILRSEEHTSELQSRENLVCRLL